VSAPAAHGAHLGKLVDGGLLSVEQHGRHRYSRLTARGMEHLRESFGPELSPDPA